MVSIWPKSIWDAHWSRTDSNHQPSSPLSLLCVSVCARGCTEISLCNMIGAHKQPHPADHRKKTDNRKTHTHTYARTQTHTPWSYSSCCFIDSEMTPESLSWICCSPGLLIEKEAERPPEALRLTGNCVQNHTNPVTAASHSLN